MYASDANSANSRPPSGSSRISRDRFLAISAMSVSEEFGLLRFRRRVVDLAGGSLLRRERPVRGGFRVVGFLLGGARDFAPRDGRWRKTQFRRRARARFDLCPRRCVFQVGSACRRFSSVASAHLCSEWIHIRRKLNNHFW